MLNRSLCDVLQEMRDCHKTRNYSYLPGLIEEAQSMGSRMESALWDQKELRTLQADISKLKKKKKKLEKK